MDKVTEKLLTFVMEYVKNKDLVFRRIESVEKKDDGFFVKYKHKNAMFFAEPSLNDATFKKLEKIEFPSMVVLNNKQNLEFLKKHWKDFLKNKHLSIYFVNPYSKIDRVWIIFPYTHDKVSDAESLNLGLQTMFENVEEIGFNEIEKIIK